MSKSTQRVILSIGAISCFASGALAQESRPSGSPFEFEIDTLAVGTSKADFDAGGVMSRSRWSLQPSFSYNLSPQVSYGLALEVGRTSYDFGGSNGPTQSIDLDEYSVSAPMRFAIGDRGMAFVEPSLSFAGEDGVSSRDGTTYGLIAAAA